MAAACVLVGLVFKRLPSREVEDEHNSIAVRDSDHGGHANVWDPAEAACNEGDWQACVNRVDNAMEADPKGYTRERGQLRERAALALNVRHGHDDSLMPMMGARPPRVQRPDAGVRRNSIHRELE